MRSKFSFIKIQNMDKELFCLKMNWLLANTKTIQDVQVVTFKTQLIFNFSIKFYMKLFDFRASFKKC